MSMDELTHALCRQAGALRDRGAGSQADDLEQAATELVQLRAENAAMRAEILRLRWRLSDAEIIGAAVRIRSLPTINSAQIDNEPQP